MSLFFTLINVTKISELFEILTQDKTPEGYKPFKGQLAYFASWGNCMIYRENAPYYPGIIYLGKIEDGFDLLNRTGEVKVRI